MERYRLHDDEGFTFFFTCSFFAIFENFSMPVFLLLFVIVTGYLACGIIRWCTGCMSVRVMLDNSELIVYL